MVGPETPGLKEEDDRYHAAGPDSGLSEDTYPEGLQLSTAT